VIVYGFLTLTGAAASLAASSPRVSVSVSVVVVVSVAAVVVVVVPSTVGSLAPSPSPLARTARALGDPLIAPLDVSRVRPRLALALDYAQKIKKRR
jgi:hypothetical protein